MRARDDLPTARIDAILGLYPMLLVLDIDVLGLDIDRQEHPLSRKRPTQKTKVNRRRPQYILPARRRNEFPQRGSVLHSSRAAAQWFFSRAAAMTPSLHDNAMRPPGQWGGRANEARGPMRRPRQ